MFLSLFFHVHSLSDPLSLCPSVETNSIYHCVPCSDSDECASGESCCSHFCRNYPGGYECSCRAGYRLNPDGCGCDGKSAGLLAVYLVWLYSVFYVVAQLCRTEIPSAHLLTNCPEMRLFKAISEQKTRTRTFCSRRYNVE